MLLANDAPQTGVITSATTRRSKDKPVNATVIKACSVNCPGDIGGIVAPRNLFIERLDADENVLLSAKYAMPNLGGRDRLLDFQIDVALINGASVRARFDDCAPAETQWIVINYDF